MSRDSESVPHAVADNVVAPSVALMEQILLETPDGPSRRMRIEFARDLAAEADDTDALLLRWMSVAHHD